LLQQQQQQQQQQVKHCCCCCFVLPQQLQGSWRKLVGLLLPEQELAGAAAFYAGRQQSLPPLPPSHGTKGNSQALAHRRNKNDVCLHVYNTIILCICRSSRHMLMNARFRIHTTAADSASQLTYWPIFFQLLNFAKKEKYRSKVMLQGFNCQN
jgi:hypothetical protein